MASSCPFCGQPTREQSRFCPRCGRTLEARLAVGAQLKGGDYRIVRSLTKGGMGAVYLAEDRRAFDRLCVVKQMLEYYDPTDPEERQRAEQRFQEEGRILAALSHPGIPKIYAFFAENGRYYLVMEYIQGETLETFVTHEDDTGRTIPTKRMPREEVVRCAIRVCRILEYLHSQPRPVVHQDVKPANMILESQLGDVRLVDFGTAHARAPRHAQPGDGRKSSVYGTDGYAPPEQYRGNPVPRSDVFALAATTYHLLTDDDPRDHPFKWPELKALPRELALALERALRTTPEQRSTARELRQALEALSTPKRTLEAFTFPGGNQIRTVGALPTLCDEHWDAARSFLHNGDFQRWLRDINRHDLVVAADEIVKREGNRDAALEDFLHVVDTGLPHPRIVVDPPDVNLGSIARESALLRRVTALNVSRGYTLGAVSVSQPWIETHPKKLHLWAGIPADIRVNVRAENLPFRSQQRGTVTIQADGHDPVEIPVTARVSLTRESWRLIWRTISAALPESWRMIVAGWHLVAQGTRAFIGQLTVHPWLPWLIWLVLSVGIGMGLNVLRPGTEDLLGLGQHLQMPADWSDDLPALWLDVRLALFYIAQGFLGIPIIVSTLWLALLLLVTTGCAAWGALRGAWKSVFR